MCERAKNLAPGKLGILKDATDFASFQFAHGLLLRYSYRGRCPESCRWSLTQP